MSPVETHLKWLKNKIDQNVPVSARWRSLESVTYQMNAFPILYAEIPEYVRAMMKLLIGFVRHLL
jgi:hypothetical protein